MTRADGFEQLSLADELARQQRPSAEDMRTAQDMRSWSAGLDDAVEAEDEGDGHDPA
jgi:hypothetical protein